LIQDVSGRSPVTELIEPVTQFHRTIDGCNIPSSVRENTSKTNGCNPLAIIVIAATALPELTVPERFVAVHLEPKGLKFLDDRLHHIYRDYNIIPVDPHRTM
jgi:hypothetical protein